MADSDFNKIPFEKLTAAQKELMAANAKGYTQVVKDPVTNKVTTYKPTAEEYYNLRGGINRSGYYGDAYQQAAAAGAPYLTEEEYAAAKAGKTGVASGQAINLATAKKRYDTLIAQGVDPAQASIQSGYDPKTNSIITTSSSVSSSGSVVSTGDNSALLALIQSLQNQIAQSKTDAAAEKAAKELAERQSAFDILYSEMDAIGLSALVEPLRGLIQQNVSPSEFNVRLRASEAYKMRFAANDERIKKGLRVLSPGEYIRVEDAYRQTLRTYGLTQFDNDAYVRQFIENDISAAELSDRVAMAVQRVQNADPAISRTLRDYYGIGQTDLVAYVLDPNQQLQKIQRQVAAAEIGTAARVQGLEAGVGVSEQLAAQGITQAQAQKGYATIADILPTAEKLSQIYGATMEDYRQAEAEQEIFNQLASAQRRRESLTKREQAQFAGTSGLSRVSLSQMGRGQF